MADVLLDRIARGSVILLHDAIQRSMQNVPQYNREQMVEAVDITLNRLSGRLQFVTIPTLLRPQFELESEAFSGYEGTAERSSRYRTETCSFRHSCFVGFKYPNMT